jgi:hypothetical protein
MGGPPLWTNRPRKRGYEIPHSQRMFGERGFQIAEESRSTRESLALPQP